MKTIEALARAGIDVGVNIAPVIPGLSDADIPTLLERASDAGATRANFIFLRLPGNVRQVFTEQLRDRLPLRAERVLSHVRAARGGRLNDPRFGSRMAGEGPYAKLTRSVFDTHVRRLGLNRRRVARPLEPRTFRRAPTSPQLSLF